MVWQRGHLYFREAARVNASFWPGLISTWQNSTGGKPKWEDPIPAVHSFFLVSSLKSSAFFNAQTQVPIETLLALSLYCLYLHLHNSHNSWRGKCYLTLMIFFFTTSFYCFLCCFFFFQRFVGVFSFPFGCWENVGKWRKDFC